MTSGFSPDQIEIHPLAELHPEDIRSLNVGYVSHGYYRVSKDETPARTVFTLDLVESPGPLEKHWDTDDDELALLQQVAAAGFSYAAYAGGQMVGIALCEPRLWNRSLWVWDFHVSPQYRRSGIGSRLMEQVFASAVQAGLRIVGLEVQSSNLPAIAFYRRCGFEIDGLDLSLYTNQDVERNEVALYMKKKL